jgi:hypothetical protein
MRKAARCLVVVIALATLGFPEVSGAAPGSSSPRPAKTHRFPKKLWRSYPLRPTSTAANLQPRTTPQPRTVPARPTNVSAGSDNGATRTRAWQWLVVAMALILSATALGVVTVSSHIRQGGAFMDRHRFTGRGDRDSIDDEQERQEPDQTEHTADAANRVASYLGSQSSTLSEPAHTASGHDVDSVLGQVGSVLHAAEEAAARMKAEARQQAEGILQHAETEATTRTEGARREADAAKADADRIRSEAQDWSSQTREIAENYAAEKRAQAEAEGKNIVATAERHAATFAIDAESRHENLMTDISIAEARLRQLVSGLQDLAAQLDRLLSTPIGSQAGERQDILDDVAPKREREEVPT